MSDFLAVDNNTFEIEVRPVLIPSTAIATPNNGTATPVTPGLFGEADCQKVLDTKCDVQGDDCLKDKITQKGVFPLGAKDDFSCIPLSVAPFTFSVAGIYTILAGAIKNKMSTIAPMLEGDTTIVNCTCVGVDTNSLPFTGSCTVTITKAGQTVLKGV